MKKKILSSYCITFMLFCQIALCFGMVANVNALTSRQESAISTKCELIHNSLQSVSANDARVYTNISHYFEIINTRFIVPLNLRLTRNNTPNNALTDLQVSFVNTRADFRATYLDYQRMLEELKNYNCSSNPQEFYTKLVAVREKRASLASYTTKLRGYVSNFVEKVKGLKNGK